MKTAKKWTIRILVAFIALLLILSGIALAMPITQDVRVPDDELRAGSISVPPSTSGLQREFPAVLPPKNEHLAELGRELFFDPILSANNDTACATCHQPDLGLGDGRPTAVGPTGVDLGRNAPTLWNVAYNANFFWDGHVDTLEAQAVTPLTHADEMAADPATTIAELEAIAAYKDLFEMAFGPDQPITLDSIIIALAEYERTFISNSSPFDRYAAGDFEALSTQQRRGLALFRSGATRCFECHTPPTFASDTFRVVGVDDDDLGRAAITTDGVEGAFRVPTLRNIALTAPYMHNGSMATLGEVLDFYADGGGRAFDRAHVDVFVQGFEMSDSERDDLLAFLYALTDETNVPAIPETTLSGLPTITAVENPARALVEKYNRPANFTAQTLPDHEPRTITVQPGQTVQEAVDSALPGDTILIPYATYHERVALDMNNLTIEGIPNADGDYPIFDGQGTLTEAIIASGNDFSVGKLHIMNYTDNGVLVEGVNNVHFYDLISESTGTYGIYPVQSTGVLIERVIASKVDDAAIYAGQCRNVVIRDSVVFDSVIGIEIENSVNGEAYNNYAYNNTTGFLFVVLPQLTSKTSRITSVHDNVAENNNLANFGDAGGAASILPPGVGILLLGTDDAEVYNNVVKDNKTAGVAIFNVAAGFDSNELDIGPLPENNWVHDNEYENNGYDPDAMVTDMGIPSGDILWDGSGWGNRFDEPNAEAGFPVLMPRSSWPQPLTKIYFQALQLLLKVAG